MPEGAIHIVVEPMWDEMVKANLNRSQRFAEELGADPARWYQSLVSIQQSIQAQLTRREAEAMAEQTRCFALGHKGKAAWCTFKADWLSWRGSAMTRMAGVNARLRVAKALRAGQYHERWSQRQGLKWQAIMDVRDAMLDLCQQDDAWGRGPVMQRTRAHLEALVDQLTDATELPAARAAGLLEED